MSVKPETVGQARSWERRRQQYADHGLCDACASQAAWGHQCGFRQVSPPCDTCTPLVAELPDPTSSALWLALSVA